MAEGVRRTGSQVGLRTTRLSAFARPSTRAAAIDRHPGAQENTLIRAGER